MLIFDQKVIGNKIYETRTKKLLSRVEVAERAELSDRTYANIERGSTIMRTDTLLKVCAALQITPNDILVQDTPTPIDVQQIEQHLLYCNDTERQILADLLEMGFRLLNK